MQNKEIIDGLSSAIPRYINLGFLSASDGSKFRFSCTFSVFKECYHILPHARTRRGSGCTSRQINSFVFIDPIDSILGSLMEPSHASSGLILQRS